MNREAEIFKGQCLRAAMDYYIEKEMDMKKEETRKLIFGLAKQLFKTGCSEEIDFLNWKETNIKKEETKQETKECPKCKKPIPSYYRFHPECGWKEKKE